MYVQSQSVNGQSAILRNMKGITIRNGEFLRIVIGIHFEFMILESAQAGLSWSTVLKKRGGYRTAFANFDVKEVAKFDETKD